MAEGGCSSAGLCTAEEEAENVENQANEVGMIQSIFEGQMVSLNSTEYIVKVTPRVDGKVILLPAQSSSHAEEKVVTHLLLPAQSSSHAEEKAVTHLPDVTLYVSYPPSYPSHSLPDFHISASWMDTSVVPLLSDHLKGLFVPGCPVVYEWIVYLQDNLVQDYNQLSPGEDRKVAGSLPEPRSLCQIFLRSSSLIHDMEEYDKFESFQEFQSRRHECGVCFREVKGVGMCRPCSGCALLYCKDCMSDYCQSCIGDNRIVGLECPDPSCHQQLPDTYLKTVLPEQFFKRYVMMRENIELDSLPGMVFCPRCKARTMSDPTSDVVMCENEGCGFPFCRFCQQTWHGPGPCPALDKVAKGGDVGLLGPVNPAESEEQRQRRLEEMQSVLWVMSSESVRACPNCRSNIQKNGGCNKMACGKCGTSFCWCCGKAIESYDHFQRGGVCELFRNEDYLPPTKAEDITGLDSLEDIEKVMNSKCPRCSKIVLKGSHSNWIQCRWCSFQYCHQCGEPCFGAYHFDEKYGCKRYSKIKQDAKHLKSLSLQLKGSEA